MRIRTTIQLDSDVHKFLKARDRDMSRVIEFYLSKCPLFLNDFLNFISLPTLKKRRECDEKEK